MFSRMLGVPFLLAAAVGVPYVASHGPKIKKFVSSFTKPADSIAVDADHGLLQQTERRQVRPPVPQGPGATLYPTKTPLEGLQAISLQEVFSMNVSKEWVYHHWARKSTGLSELGLFGIRVPLVTGTQLYDLAGSLTYFFGSDGRVRRITFRGTTGDTNRLVSVAVQQYGLQPQATPVAGEQLFQVRRENLVFSQLRTRPAAVLWASSPHDSFTVDLDLQRSDVSTPLPPRSLPLPVGNVPPSQPPAAVATAQSGQTTAAAEPAEKAVDASEKWNPFFPRSQIPNEQVDNLDRHLRLW